MSATPETAAKITTTRLLEKKRAQEPITVVTAYDYPTAKIADEDRAYFEAEIEPLLGLSGVEYVGEIGEAEKAAFLGSARALLFPIGWPEPFGLVMIEAMACGTPVIAFPCGSVPEVIDDGITGFVVDDTDAATRALGRIDELDRGRVRQVFERRFTADRMAADYVALYEALVTRAAGEVPQVA